MDAAAFKRQLLPLHPRLYQTAFRLMGNRQDAEDMVQEAYLKLWTLRQQLPDDITPYCLRLMRNLCIDHLRRRRHDSNLPADTAGQAAHEEAAIEARSEAGLVMTLISQLPESQRVAITLHDVDACSYHEMEQLTGTAEQTLRVLLSRARNKLREQLSTLTHR